MEKTVDEKVHGQVGPVEPFAVVGVVLLQVHAIGHGPQIEQVAHQGGREQVQQKEQHPAANGEGEGQPVLPVRPAQAAQGRGHPQEVIHRYPQGVGQGAQGGHVGIAAALPPGDGFVGHPQQVCQLLLGQASGLPVLFQAFPKFQFCHKGSSFAV